MVCLWKRTSRTARAVWLGYLDLALPRGAVGLGEHDWGLLSVSREVRLPSEPVSRSLLLWPIRRGVRMLCARRPWAREHLKLESEVTKLAGSGGLLAAHRQEEGRKATPKPDSQALSCRHAALGISQLFLPLGTILLLHFFPLWLYWMLLKIMPCVLGMDRLSTKTVFPFCKSQVENAFGHIAPIEKLFWAVWTVWGIK